MHTTLLITVALACQAFGAYVVNVDLKKLPVLRGVSRPLVNLTNLLNRHRRSKETDTNKHSVTAAERLIILNEHNSYRRKVEPPAANMHYMRWNWKLAVLAQKWADGCKWKHGQPERDNKEFPRLGQNLWVGTNHYDLAQAHAQWMEEKKDYDFSTQKCTPKKMCGHFTQMIWADSTDVGCGMAFCKSMEGWSAPNSYYLVCDYAPPGNWEGRKPYAKGDACSKCPESRPKCENKLCREKIPCSTKKCLNGGTVDPVACECKCTADYEGSACENGAPSRDISRLRALSMFLSVLISCVIFG